MSANPRRARRARRTGLTLACVAGVASALLPALSAQADDPPPASTQTLDHADAERAAALVAAEDRRLTEIRTVTSLARWQGKNWETPYRMTSGAGYTLVLTPRSEPYTVTDLLALAPQTFLRMSDGSYLLSENLVVSTRATLRLGQPGGLTVRLASGPRGFVSIVSVGGKIEIAGEQEKPVRLESWDVDAGAPDTDQADGRAYVRAMGGQFESGHARLSALGFWSGRTGGLALTGTDRPNTGAITALGDLQPGGEQMPNILDGVTTQPAGALRPGQENPNLNYSVPAYDYVSSRISDTQIDGNAYGLFITGANGIQVSDSVVRNSLIGGIVLHRYVTNGIVENTTSSHNTGNGISIDRATTGITINGVTAEANQWNGLTMSGRPLATGPSATGASTADYGGNSVSNSTFTDNGHYGVEVVGGFNTGVQNNRVTGGSMGIVVRGPATKMSITGNEVDGTLRHGIALTDGVTSSTVTGNVVDTVATGVYLRDSTAQVRGNTIQHASRHGVSLVGEVTGVQVSLNVLAGRGASALDKTRSTGDVVASANSVEGWDDTSPWYFWFKKLLQPMTALWALITLLIVTSALRGVGRDRKIVHPYAHQMAHQDLLPVPSPSVVDVRGGRSSRAGT